MSKKRQETATFCSEKAGKQKTIKAKAIKFMLELWHDAIHTSWVLLKITVPVMIITKVLTDFGLIHYLTRLLEPVMNVMGLPGELGVVWATGMITTLYGAIAVFASLAPSLDLTVAQVTVLGAVMLIAHSLPIELSVSKKAGAPLLPIALLRLIGAFIYGVILSFFCHFFNIWQQPTVVFFQVTTVDNSWFDWGLNQLFNLGYIVLVIFGILLAMKVLKYAGVLNLLEKLLTPVLPVFGMSVSAAPITVVGMVLGIGYGGALIIRETALGKLTRKEIFNSMALMALCHGLLEDTLLMVSIGGTLVGLLFGRILFALIITFFIAKLIDWLPISDRI